MKIVNNEICQELKPYPSMLFSRIKGILHDELTKKDQEHKAELEMIKGEIKNTEGFSICSIHREYNETCNICGHSQISKEDAVAILDSHINKLSTE